MNTWILCAKENEAKLYQTADIREGVNFLWQVPHPEGIDRSEFAELLKLKLEDGWRADLFDYLILCAETELLDDIVVALDEDVRADIIGLVKQDLFDASPAEITEFTRDFIEDDHPINRAA